MMHGDEGRQEGFPSDLSDPVHETGHPRVHAAGNAILVIEGVNGDLSVVTITV